MLSDVQRWSVPVPELPEVETVARQLNPSLSGACLRRAIIADTLLGDPPVAELCDREVLAVQRVGKEVVFSFGAQSPHRSVDAQRWLAVHLRMTGRLLWFGDVAAVTEAVMPNGEVPKPRATLIFDRGLLVFADTRRFGTLRVQNDPVTLRSPAIDPMTPAFTIEALAKMLAKSTQLLKSWLLRQDRLVGLGNIYACEILFAAKLDPRRLAGTLTRGEIARLHAATRDRLSRAIDACGTTFSDFQDAHGVTGSFQRFLQVYQREGKPCTACRHPIARVVQQQRSTFFCPSCQR